MQDRLFFTRALEAAKTSKEAFTAEFEIEEAKANVRSDGDSGDPLIHILIEEITDTRLPDLLSILIQYGVDLKSTNTIGLRPLSAAACHGKSNAVKFLIQQKAEINDPESPALCEVIKSEFISSLRRFAIVKILIKNGANVNIQDIFTESPLHIAAKKTHLMLIRYLVKNGANPFLKFFYAGGTQSQTALGVAYSSYILTNIYGIARIKTKNCLTTLIKAVKDQIYSNIKDITFSKVEEKLKQSIGDLSADFQDFVFSKEVNSIKLKKLLERQILRPVLAERMKREQIHAFMMGSRLSKASQERKGAEIPPIYNFLRKGTSLIPLIFSYIPAQLWDESEDKTTNSQGLSKEGQVIPTSKSEKTELRLVRSVSYSSSSSVSSYFFSSNPDLSEHHQSENDHSPSYKKGLMSKASGLD